MSVKSATLSAKTKSRCQQTLWGHHSRTKNAVVVEKKQQGCRESDLEAKSDQTEETWVRAVSRAYGSRLLFSVCKRRMAGLCIKLCGGNVVCVLVCNFFASWIYLFIFVTVSGIFSTDKELFGCLAAPHGWRNADKIQNASQCLLMIWFKKHEWFWWCDVLRIFNFTEMGEISDWFVKKIYLKPIHSLHILIHVEVIPQRTK